MITGLEALSAGGGRETAGSTRQYASGLPSVLRNVSFRVGAGQTAALVGANGAGKTTLVKLLAGFYEPTEGAVLLDGISLNEYQLDDLRRNVAVVFQDYAQYQLAARENIGFGDVQFVNDDERLVHAAVRGGAASVIAKLPHHLDTMLGRQFAGGSELSGGEWQRLALARAFMRHEAQLLVLDEPTGSLDAETEAEICARIRELTKGKTTLMISHRFSTVRLADLIVVLDGGQIVEQGSHADLMARGGTYARLYELQAGRYR